MNVVAWVEGNVVNRVDPSGKQQQPPAPPHIPDIPGQSTPDWVIERIREMDREQAQQYIRQLTRSGILTRASAAAIAVTFGIPVEHGGLICNAYERAFGLCHPVWDNPETYLQLAPQPSIGAQPIITNTECLAMPLPLPQIAPFNPQVVEDVLEQTRTRTQKTCEPQAFEQWWNGLPNAPVGGTQPYDLYEERVARGAGTMETSKRVPTGAISAQFGTILQNIDADGASSSNCHLIDAKWDGGGQFRTNNPPPWIDSDTSPDFDLNTLSGELLRYRMALYSNPEPVALEIRTNTESARDFFLAALPSFGFLIGLDAFIEVIP